jgi:glycosyltransferase involved in cell wall biosynthesis
MTGNDKPKLLYLVTEDWYFRKHRSHLAGAAKEAGFEVMVAAGPGKFADVIRSEGFKYYPFSFQRRSMNPFGQARVLFKLIELYREARPDIVHHVALKPILYGSLAAKMAGVPRRVNAITGLGYIFTAEDAKRRLLRRFISSWYRFALGGAGTVNIFQNPDDKKLFIDSGLTDESHSILIRGAGVDVERFRPEPEPAGKPVIALAARMLKDKGVADLVEAAEILAAKGLDFKVVLAGSPDEHNPTAISVRKLNEWNQKPYIDWNGYVDDMAELLRNSHIACLPSYREGLPLFLLEAAAAGRPMAAADVPGCREIVKHGETGLLAEKMNPRELAQRLEELILDRDKRARMGRAARQMAVGDFSKEAVQEATIKLYKDMLSNGRPA